MPNSCIAIIWLRVMRSIAYYTAYVCIVRKEKTLNKKSERSKRSGRAHSFRRPIQTWSADISREHANGDEWRNGGNTRKNVETKNQIKFTTYCVNVLLCGWLASFVGFYLWKLSLDCMQPRVSSRHRLACPPMPIFPVENFSAKSRHGDWCMHSHFRLYNKWSKCIDAGPLSLSRTCH